MYLNSFIIHHHILLIKLFFCASATYTEWDIIDNQLVHFVATKCVFYTEVS